MRLVQNYNKPTPDLIQTIRTIGAEMRDDSMKVTDESMFESLDGTLKMHIQTYETFFVDESIFLKPENFSRTMAIMQQMIDYIASIKPEECDDSEH